MGASYCLERRQEMRVIAVIGDLYYVNRFLDTIGYYDKRSIRNSEVIVDDICFVGVTKPDQLKGYLLLSFITVGPPLPDHAYIVDLAKQRCFPDRPYDSELKK